MSIKSIRESASPTLLPEVLQALPWALGAVSIGYLAYRWFDSISNDPAKKIKNQLPLTSDLKGGINNEIDESRDYDVDGFSFDLEGIIITRDNKSTMLLPI